jgi:phospholipase/carboxylesterase
LIFSGFVPTVGGWEPPLTERRGLPVFIAHGRNDPVMSVDFAHRARNLLSGAGLDVEYHESDAGHQIDPDGLAAAEAWLRRTLPPSSI